jgi:hypothetical protein
MDKYAKLELLIRTAFREFYTDTLTSGRQKSLLLPAFEIPRAGAVDLFIAPKAGTHLCLVQRSDYVGAYKHTVGQLTGVLAHYRLMTDRQVREAIRASKSHPDLAELKQGKIDALKLSKRLVDDSKAGNIHMVLATELPDVPQQAQELQANFLPIWKLLQAQLTVAVKKKRLCQSLEAFSVNLTNDKSSVTSLTDAIKPMLKIKD